MAAAVRPRARLAARGVAEIRAKVAERRAKVAEVRASVALVRAAAVVARAMVGAIAAWTVHTCRRACGMVTAHPAANRCSNGRTLCGRLQASMLRLCRPYRQRSRQSASPPAAS